MSRQSITSLSKRTVSFQPVSFDFSASYGDNFSWSYTVVSRCDTCGKKVVVGTSGSGEFHAELDPSSKCKGYVTADSPMMNYYYPLPDNVEVKESAEKLIDLPLCIVEIEGSGTAMALTGCGMDMTWEICEAYMLLGMLPPTSFADSLPLMSDRGNTAKDRWIISGCRTSINCALLQAKYSLRSLKLNFPARSQKPAD